MAAEEVARLRGVYDAFDRGDVDAMVELLAHDVEWCAPDSLPWGGTRHGHDGVRAFRDLLDEHVDSGWGDPDEFLEAGDRIVVTGRFSGSARDSGRSFETPFVHVWTFSDGVPSRVAMHVDTAAVLQALNGG